MMPKAQMNLGAAVFYPQSQSLPPRFRAPSGPSRLSPSPSPTPAEPPSSPNPQRPAEPLAIRGVGRPHMRPVRRAAVPAPPPAPPFDPVISPPPRRPGGLDQTLAPPMAAPMPRTLPTRPQAPLADWPSKSPVIGLATIEEACWLDELFGSPDLGEGWTDDPPERSTPVLFDVPSPSPPLDLLFAPWQDQQGGGIPAPILTPRPYPEGYGPQPNPSPPPSPASAWLPPFAFPHYFAPCMPPYTRSPTYQMPNGRMSYYVWGDPDGVAQLTMTASVGDMQDHHARLYQAQETPPRFRR